MNCTHLSSLAAIHCSGPDAAAFLQAQLSADIGALEPDEATFACYCSARGQVLALLLVCRQSEGFVLIGAAELLPTILQRLRLYVLRAKVVFTPGSDTVYGLGDAPANDRGAFTPGASATGDLKLAYAIAPPQRCDGDAETWKARELSRGVAWLSAQTTERFIPQMLGFETIGAVSFAKGCYPGQEIVARAHYLGTVKRKPLLLALQSAATITPGDKLEIQRGEEWLEAQVIDSARADAARQIVFTVAPADATDETDAVTAVRFEGRLYGCATI
ncbi:MAG: hypothetical protein RQ826_06755 [Xanthomonadales bacterium]|nr:hypothetical protein [Xanthomonadales bacterium]